MDEDDDVVDNFCYRVKYSLPNKSVAYSDKYFIRMRELIFVYQKKFFS